RVQEDGAEKGSATVLNFTGNGVSVDTVTSENPPRIGIKIPGGTTGIVNFPNMSVGEVRVSGQIPHRLTGDLVAFVVGLEDPGITANRPIFLGGLGVFATALNLDPIDIPQIGVFYIPSGSRTFAIRLQRNNREGGVDRDYRVRWWAIPTTD